MKRIIDTLIISAVSLLAFSCQEEQGLDVATNESIVLDLSSGLSRAADTDVESYVNHLDVFIFNADGNVPGTLRNYGRYNVNNSSSVTLSAKRSSFASGERFYVYILANSILTEQDFSEISSYNDLIDRKQEDINLHLSGLSIDSAPKHFLMDAVATDGTGEKAVVLNNGVYDANTVLEAVLKRAAAKVAVNITASEKVQFRNFTLADGSEGGLYYLRNMPYDTYLLSEARSPEQIRNAKVRNTTKTNNAYFTWNPAADSRHVSLVTYVYPNNWADESILEHEACIVMNLPLTYTSDGTSTDHHNSWYKIPMTDEKMFRRNNYYEVNITINRPGAINESVPVELEDIFYDVTAWTEKDIYVGGDDKPKYLSVNKDELAMHNVATDASSLEFASSSPVTITVKDVYFYNKFGVKTTVSPDISGTTDGGIAGNITVNSPVPTNNAIRYFTLVITNQDGISREVAVTQYPLEYITNTQAYYSYRTDFTNSSNPDPTTYEHRGSRYVSAAWGNNAWTYHTGTGDGYFFTSKVAEKNNDGTSDIYYYSYGQNSNTPSKSRSRVSGLDNARMYHVQITATSSTYVSGIPEKDEDGYTDSSQDNAKLVSPSFMIASQLGAVFASGGDTQSNRNRAKTHCKEYAETYIDENGEVVHLTDWRLPTAAEIGIIVKFQTSSEVMDVVLGGRYYFCASGTVGTGIGGNNDGYFLRCIRDVY